MFIIRKMSDAERFVREFEEIVTVPEDMYPEIVVATGNSEDLAKDAKEVLLLNTSTNSFYLEVRDKHHDEIVFNRVLMYAPAVVDLVWQQRKEINKQLRQRKEVTA